MVDLARDVLDPTTEQAVSLDGARQVWQEHLAACGPPPVEPPVADNTSASVGDGHGRTSPTEAALFPHEHPRAGDGDGDGDGVGEGGGAVRQSREDGRSASTGAHDAAAADVLYEHEMTPSASDGVQPAARRIDSDEQAAPDDGSESGEDGYSEYSQNENEQQ